MKVEAVLFDCDGVLADNEKDAHQEAFNQAFKKSGLDIFWDDQLYMTLIKVGGGKERLKHFFEQYGWPENTPDHDGFIRKLHERKSKIYKEIISSGKIVARPGVISFMEELVDKKIPYAICSTSKKESVNSIARHVLNPKIEQGLKFILAGDDVTQKKPSPEIYLKAAKALDIKPKNCLVIEDSPIGLAAAKTAGMRVVITPSYYSKSEIFENADIILKNLQNISLEMIVNRLSS